MSATGPCSVPGEGKEPVVVTAGERRERASTTNSRTLGVAQHHVHVGVGLGAQDGSPLGADTSEVRLAAFHHQVRDGFLGDAWRVVKGGAGWGR